MVIFHSYVSLPEGKANNKHPSWDLVLDIALFREMLWLANGLRVITLVRNRGYSLTFQLPLGQVTTSVNYETGNQT